MWFRKTTLDRTHDGNMNSEGPRKNMQNIIEQTDTRTTSRCKKNVIQRTLTQLENVGHNGLDRQSLPVATICVLMMKFWRCSARAALRNHT